MYAEVELTRSILVSPLIVHLKQLTPKKRDEQISFFQKLDHLIKLDEARKNSVSFEPQSLKCQAMRAVLKRNFGNIIATWQIPNDLKEQLIAEEKIMDVYYNDICRCLKNGFNGTYRPDDNNCVYDILMDFAQQKNVSRYFLEIIKKIKKLNDSYFFEGVTKYNQNIGTIGEILISDAAKANNSSFVMWLLEQGVSPNSDDNAHCKTSIFMRAVQNKNYDLARTLIAYGANVNCECHSNVSFVQSSVTPLFEAVENGCEDLVELLLQNNAKVSKTNGCQKQTALHCAFNNWVKLNVKIPKLLLQYGAVVDVKDKYLNTPLMYASKNLNFPGVQFLLLSGANVNACDEAGQTSLMLAVQDGHHKMRIVPIIDTLITHNSDVNALDKHNMSAIDLALESYKRNRDSGYSTKESKNVINFLLSKKPKVKIATKIGLFYHLNRNKIWKAGTSLTFVGLSAGTYLYFKKNNLLHH